MRRKKTKLTLLVAIVIGIVMVRFYLLPYWVVNHLERQLDKIEGYQIHYSDVSISLFSGSYSLEDVQLVRKGTSLPFPFFEAERVTFGIEGSSLLKKFLVGVISVQRPVINFIKGPDPTNSQTDLPHLWTEAMNELAFLPINKVDVIDGQIDYHDFHAIPKVSLRMTNISLTLKNLHNVNGEEKILSALAEGTGKVMDADVKINIELNSFYKTPMFNLTAELTELNLYDVRDFLKAYARTEVQQGIFSIYTQASTRQNKIIGYVKPLMEDVTIASYPSDQNDQYLMRKGTSDETGKLRLTTSNAATNNLRKIEFEGSLDEPGLNLWSAIGTTLHNSFIEALITMLEKSVNTSNESVHRSKPKKNSSQVSKRKNKDGGMLKRIFKRKQSREKRSFQR